MRPPSCGLWTSLPSARSWASSICPSLLLIMGCLSIGTCIWDLSDGLSIKKLGEIRLLLRIVRLGLGAPGSLLAPVSSMLVCLQNRPQNWLERPDQGHWRLVSSCSTQNPSSSDSLIQQISPPIQTSIIISQMNWLVDPPQRHEHELLLLKKLTKVTLYDHNFQLSKNFQDLTFSCILNCKRLNRQYSIIGKIEGDLLNHTIQINCALVDYKSVVIGRWQHQKIELTKFAYRYNQKSARISTTKASQDSNNYQIKVNPISGEFYVCYHFLLGEDLIKDYEKFKMKMTDQCQKLTGESEKIFNTIIEVIFDQEANDPYLKSDERVGMHFSRPVKVGKLLRKIKKLSTISSFYKIKHELGVQNKYRSAFRKIYLRKTQKPINNPFIIENALLMIPKFCKKHLDALPESAQPAKKKNLIISPFEDLEDNHEIEFATRHLEDFSKAKTGQSIIDITANFSPQEKLLIAKPGLYNIKGVPIRVEALPSKQKKIYEYELLNKINFKHQNIFQYYHIKGQQFANLRITQYINETPLQEYLEQQSSTMSLSTRLDIMVQICHVLEVMHKFHVGYFLDFKNVYITQGNVVKIKDFTSCYCMSCWDETKEKEKTMFKKYLMEDYKDYLNVCGYVNTENNQKMEDEGSKDRAKFQNQRADIFSLGMVLYRILIEKFPFSTNCISILEQNYKKVEDFLNQIWVVETESFLRKGGTIVKLLCHLLLKCFHMETQKRPFIEWITVILSQVKSSLECLY